MSNEDRLDVSRLADDGCPNVSGDTQTIDVAELLAAARRRGTLTGAERCD